MLSKLLYKEFKLALHPAAVLFLLLSSMMLIPNYPMYVLFSITRLAYSSSASADAKITTLRIPSPCQ